MREPKRTAVEGVLVALAGVAIALTANAMNPSGLKLGRDYFMANGSTASATRSNHATRPAPPAATAPNGEGDSTATPTTATGDPPAGTDPYEGLTAETRAKLEHFDLRPIRQQEVRTLFESPLYAAGLYVIIDARDDRAYAEGHLPGAYHLYYYEQEQYIQQVLPFAQGAEKVIVYCNGGDCEDSALTAVLLRDQYFVDPARVFVYAEGYESWTKAGLPVERGVRNSGDIITSHPAAEGVQ